MIRELVPDYGAEEFYRYLIPPSVLGNLEETEDTKEPGKEKNQCIVFCKKVSPSVFNISKGVAVVEGTQTCFNDGICMITPSTKVVFVFENS